MDRILLNLYVPSVSESFDIFAPIDIPVGVITPIIADGVAYIAKGRYHVSGREMLMTDDPSMLLQPECTLEQYGVQDGDKIIML